MKESISTINTNNTATAQAGQVISLAACREQKISESPFADNLDYLQALELEGLLILSNALFRLRGADGQSKFDYAQLLSMTGLSAAEIKPEKLAELIPLIEQKNRHRVEMAEQEGIVVYFTKFCREKKISGFDRKIIMLLFLLATSERFTKTFDLCAFGDDARKGSEVKIGTMLNIICSDYREQLASRRYFSLESSLISQDILHIECTVEDKSSILERYVSINDRYVRYLIGDNNFYKSASSMIQRDNGSVRLDQVIIPEETKKELVARVGNYLACRDNKKANMLDDFYGYGTALTLLFHGPSGTGKTMMAQALAHHFHKPLYSLKSRESQPESMNIIDDGVKKIFLEAFLNAGIVYFDEADDFFVKDTLLSRLLLIEIEKARCVVILSTNKPVDLDPAMDRRLSLKVCFSIPDAELRYKMWQALMPTFVKLAPDIDFRRLAESYKFTGGLIKNSILMTLVSSLTAGNKENSTVTMEMIEHAAQLQLHQMVDMKDLYQIYTPVYKRSDLQIGVEQKIQLGNVANVYRNMQEKKTGLNILITSNDMQTGIDAVEALANECHLKIKRFNYTDVFKRNTVDGKVFDPITQTKKFPIELAFAENTGDSSLLLFVDYDSIARWTDQKRFEWNSMERMFMDFDLRSYLKSYQGLFCMVTVPPLQKIPREFNIHLNLEYPPEETQMQQWEKTLGKNKVSDDELVSLVENNPLHIAEIDYIAKQAIIQSAIKASSGGLTIKDIDNVIARYSPKRATPLLFGKLA